MRLPFEIEELVVAAIGSAWVHVRPAVREVVVVASVEGLHDRLAVAHQVVAEAESRHDLVARQQRGGRHRLRSGRWRTARAAGSRPRSAAAGDPTRTPSVKRQLGSRDSIDPGRTARGACCDRRRRSSSVPNASNVPRSVNPDLVDRAVEIAIQHRPRGAVVGELRLIVDVLVAELEVVAAGLLGQVIGRRPRDLGLGAIEGERSAGITGLPAGTGLDGRARYRRAAGWSSSQPPASSASRNRRDRPSSR